MSRLVAAPWKLCLLLAMFSFLLQVWLFHPLVAGYFPTLDEIAMQAASSGIGGSVHPLQWFTHGLHGYFVPYPEWSAWSPDYWRPLVNCWYWLNWQLFGQQWGNQLIFGYLVHSLVVGLVCYFALRVLELNWVCLGAVVVIALLNPAYVFQSLNDPFSIPRALQFPIYQIEVIVALLMMAAILAYLRGRYWEFSLIAVAALLFKESALALPVSAALLWQWWHRGQGLSEGRSEGHRDGRRAASAMFWLLLPLAVWTSGRLVAGFNGAIHVLPPGAGAGWVTKPVRNLLFWPTGLYQSSLGATRAALAAHDWPALLRYLAELCIDLAWWAALAIAAVAGYRLWRSRTPGAAPAPWLIVLVFALGNLLWALSLPVTELRYGYLWFALGPAAIFAVLSRHRLGTPAAVVLTLCLVVPQLHSLAQALSAPPLAAYDLAKQSARQLVTQLAQMPAGTGTVYLLDDLVVQSSSPQYFARFAKFPGTLVLVNNLAPIRRCNPEASAPEGPRYRLYRDTGATVLDYEAPRCFERAWNVAPLDQFDSGHFIQRGPWMNYHFPELSTDKGSIFGNRFDYDPGRHWSLRVRDPACAAQQACAWLGFDPRERRYYPLAYPLAQ